MHAMSTLFILCICYYGFLLVLLCTYALLLEQVRNLSYMSITHFQKLYINNATGYCNIHVCQYSSDPHKYSAMIKRKGEDRRDSPLSKSHLVHPSPPKDRPHDLSVKSKPVATSNHKVLRRTNSRENEEKRSLTSPSGNIPGMPLASGKVQFGILNSLVRTKGFKSGNGDCISTFTTHNVE